MTSILEIYLPDDVDQYQLADQLKSFMEMNLTKFVMYTRESRLNFEDVNKTAWLRSKHNTQIIKLTSTTQQ